MGGFIVYQYKARKIPEQGQQTWVNAGVFFRKRWAIYGQKGYMFASEKQIWGGNILREIFARLLDYVKKIRFGNLSLLNRL